MRGFYAIFICVIITVFFYIVLVDPMYRNINTEKKSLIKYNNLKYKEKNYNYNIVEEISQMASLIGIDAEASISNNNIHVKVIGNYQQLIQLVIGLVEKSQSLFILSLSLSSTGAQESDGNLEMNAILGMY